MKADTVVTLTPLDQNGRIVTPIKPFTFTRYEVPEKIPFGGDQSVAVHQLIGGRRVVDSMGRSDMPLEWSGLFLGENALQRARYLDYLRKQGRACQLTWSELDYKIVIQSFKADFERFYKLPYHITCIVVRDESDPVKSAPDSIDQAIGDDLATANQLSAEINDGPLSSVMSTLDSAVSSVQSFAGAVQSTINTVMTPIAAVQSRVQALIGTVGNTVQNVTTLGGILPNNPIAQQASSLLGQATAMNQLPQLYQLQSVLGRMSGNISNIGTVGTSVTTAGGNLFQMAQNAYGDATAWTGIAQANNMTDPVVSGVQTITVPAAPSSNGGVLGQ